MAAKNEDTMLERGKFVANGYTFMVKPVYLGEEDSYLSEMAVSPVPISDDEKSLEDKNDKDLSKWAIALFSNSLNGVKKKNHGKVFEFFRFIFRRRDYRYYSDVPAIQPLIKWLERKVTYKGKRVLFYELERKYGLSKSDIERLFIYFHEISGF